MKCDEQGNWYVEEAYNKRGPGPKFGYDQGEISANEIEAVFAWLRAHGATRITLHPCSGYDGDSELEIYYRRPARGDEIAAHELRTAQQQMQAEIRDRAVLQQLLSKYGAPK